VQLLTDVTHGLVVNVEATTDAIDYRQLQTALNRCRAALESSPKQIVADGDYTNYGSVKAAEAAGVNYGSWQDSWKPGERDAAPLWVVLFHTTPSMTSISVRLAAFNQPCCVKWGARGTQARLQSTEAGLPTSVHRDPCGAKKPSADWRRSLTRLEEPAATVLFKAKMKTEEAQKIYKQRSQIAEFPHAWIKQRCGPQFRCRGRWKASIEATWACLGCNITRWFGIGRKPNAAAAA
jgi:hypothetical protein